VPKENAHPQRWVEHKLSDGTRVFGSRVSGQGGTIWFLANGKVAHGVGGPAFEEQKRKIIRRFKPDEVLLANLENALSRPSDILLTQILREIIELPDQATFDRRVDVLVRTLRAIRALWLGRFETSTGRRFMAAVRELARKHKRPPTKAEITEHLCCELSQTSKWCRDHGFEWLPNAPVGRRRTGRRRSC
jgi:hypothetical protein